MLANIVYNTISYITKTLAPKMVFEYNVWLPVAKYVNLHHFYRWISSIKAGYANSIVAENKKPVILLILKHFFSFHSFAQLLFDEDVK